jgi:hypothetical protein
VERGGGAAGSAEVQEHAWRWRFSRKWATEQRRYYEQPEAAAASVASDDLDAMEFTQVCLCVCVGLGTGRDWGLRSIGKVMVDVMLKPSWRSWDAMSRASPIEGKGRHAEMVPQNCMASLPVDGLGSLSTKA